MYSRLSLSIHFYIAHGVPIGHGTAKSIGTLPNYLISKVLSPNSDQDYTCP